MSTSATILGGVRRVDLDELSASFFRFARQVRKEGRPCHVTDALCQTMSVQHPIDVQVFHTNDAKAINYLTRLLMGKVVSFELDPLMNTCDDCAMLATFRGALRKLGVFALCFCQCFLFLAKETRVLNLFCIREGSKCFESHINPYLLVAFGQAFGFTLTRKGEVPFACTGTMNSSSFDGATHRTMVHHFDGADFGEGHAVIMGDAKAALRIGEGVIASVAFEARVSRLLTSLDATKERFDGKVNSYCYVLQDLTMYSIEGRTLLFQHRIGCLLAVTTQTLAFLLIGRFPVLKQVVIKPSALFKSVFKASELFLGWENPILKILSHRVIVVHFKQQVNTCLTQSFVAGILPIMSHKGGPFIPMHRMLGPSGPLGK